VSENEKIVLIEDDADLYSLIQYNLDKEGFAMVGFADRQGAIELCRRERPDLIIWTHAPDSTLWTLQGNPRTFRSSSTPGDLPEARASETNRIGGWSWRNDYIVKPFFCA